MLNFLKAQSYLIFRCIAIQIGMTMFGMVLSMAATNDGLMLGCGIGSVLFYMYLLADAAWSCGSKEQVKVDAGRAEAKPLTGLYASLVANALNIGLALAIWVGFFVAQSGGGVTPSWAMGCKMVATFIQGMYSGIIGYVNTYVSDAGIVSALMYTLILLPAPLVCGFAYYHGMKGIHTVPFYGKSEKTKKK